ncbi:MAG: DUF4013 domain-containing protein [Candidatus Eremiobacteraeota bacterium]|nr:DUF4013 domain-containing protein [Candidatus Eremiobacteraeota bacterium]
MAIDFKAPLRDSQAGKKIALGTLFSIIPIVFFAPLGYIQLLIERALDGTDDGTLPEWDDFTGHLFRGLGGFVVVAGYALIACLPGAITMLSFGYIYGTQSALAKGTMQHGLFGEVLVGLVGLVALGLWALVVMLMPIALACFAESGDIPGGFRFRDIFEFVSADPGEYFGFAWLLLLIPVAGILGWMLPVPYLRQVLGYACGFYIWLVVAREVAAYHKANRSSAYNA